jgi:microcystin-dependent protein
MWAGAGELPRGWLLADGSYVSRSSYAGLFEVIGTQFGEGDGSTTFQLPGFVGRFPLGVNTVGMLGLKGGSSEVTLTVDQIPSHSHLVFGNTVGYSGSVVRAPVLNSGPSNVSTGESGGDQPHSNMPPYIGVYFIIYAGE